MDFRTELTSLLNKFSIENNSNTADYILSEYLINCLQAYDKAVLQIDKHTTAVLQRDKHTTVPFGTTPKENPYGVDFKPPTEIKLEVNKPIPAKVGNTTTTGWSNPFCGTSWGA